MEIKSIHWDMCIEVAHEMMEEALSEESTEEDIEAFVEWLREVEGAAS